MNPLDPDFSSKISSRKNIFHEKSVPYWMAGYEMFWPARARLFSKKIFETVVENDSDTVSEIRVKFQSGHYKNDQRARRRQKFRTLVMVRTHMYTQLLLLFTVLSAWFGLVRPRGHGDPRTDQYSNYSNVKFKLDQSDYGVACTYQKQ